MVTFLCPREDDTGWKMLLVEHYVFHEGGFTCISLTDEYTNFIVGYSLWFEFPQLEIHSIVVSRFI